jgi:hypothetical protein
LLGDQPKKDHILIFFDGLFYLSSLTHKFKYFCSFSLHVISSKLNSLGVSLGSIYKEIDVSTRVLKHMEFDRLTVIPKVSTMLDSTYLDEEEAIATSDG